MARGRGREADATVELFVVVPLDKRGDPCTGGVQACKGGGRRRGAVLQRPKQRLRKGIVVADRRATERGHDAQPLYGGQHGRAFHRPPVIRMHGHLMLLDALHMADGVDEP